MTGKKTYLFSISLMLPFSPSFSSSLSLLSLEMLLDLLLRNFYWPIFHPDSVSTAFPQLCTLYIHFIYLFKYASHGICLLSNACYANTFHNFDNETMRKKVGCCFIRLQKSNIISLLFFAYSASFSPNEKRKFIFYFIILYLYQSILSTVPNWRHNAKLHREFFAFSNSNAL